MTAGGLAGASAESAEAAAAHRRRNAAWRLAFDSAASRLRRNSAWRLAFDSCRAARGAPVGGPCGVQASIALTKRSKQRCRNFVRTEFPLVVDLGASLRSAWGCLASRLTLAVRREAHSLGTGVPRFARHGGASLRSARRLPFGFELPCGERKVGGGREAHLLAARVVSSPHCPDEAVQAADGEMSECKRVRTEFPRLREYVLE